MRRLTIKALFVAMPVLCFSSGSNAQVAVSATVKDANGTPCSGGTVVANLNNPISTPPTVNGQQIGGTVQGNLDNNGAFSINVWPNATASPHISPPGTTWTFTVNCNSNLPPPVGTGGQQAIAASQSITAATSLSTTLSNALPLLTNIATSALTPPLVVTATADNQTPLTLNTHSATASVPALIVNGSSPDTVQGLVSITGKPPTTNCTGAANPCQLLISVPSEAGSMPLVFINDTAGPTGGQTTFIQGDDSGLTVCSNSAVYPTGGASCLDLEPNLGTPFAQLITNNGSPSHQLGFTAGIGGGVLAASGYSNIRISALTGVGMEMAQTNNSDVDQAYLGINSAGGIVLSPLTGQVVNSLTNVSAPTFTSSVAIGTPPFTVTSTTNVPNLNASSLSGATFAAPGAIGGTTPAAGTFTPGVTLGVAGTTSGVLTLAGSASGSATITAPATAGTSTNPITISNSLQLPSGTVYNWNGDTGLSRDSAGVVDVGTGAAASKAGSINLTNLTATGQLTDSVATGTAPLVITSTTTVPNLTVSNHPKVQDCGTTSACSHTALTTAQIVKGSAPLVSGTPSTVTISGISPAFTSSTSYVCTVSGQSSATTNLLSVANVSSSSFTITGPATTTTVINYICVGN